MPCIRYEFGTKVVEKPEPLLSLFMAHSLCILWLGFVSTVTRVGLLLRKKREEMLVKLLGTPRTCVIGEREREEVGGDLPAQTYGRWSISRLLPCSVLVRHLAAGRETEELGENN